MCMGVNLSGSDASILFQNRPHQQRTITILFFFDRLKMSTCYAIAIFLAFLMMSCANAGIGVNWGSQASVELPPTIVVQLLKDNGIQKVKLFESDDAKLKALAGSGIEVMVAIPNHGLGEMTNYTKAKEWVRQNVTSYNINSSSGVKIRYVAIGNEPFLVSYNGIYVNQTFPALENVQKALNEAGVGNTVKATVPLNADVYISPSNNPVPSAGRFRTDIRNEMAQIVQFLSKNNAPFVVNVYPFLSLYLFGGNFPMDYAFFDGRASPLVDNGNGFSYPNMLDANYDTLVAALTAEGYGNLSIVIGEMGWPTEGDKNANVNLATRFYNGLLPKIASKKGSPVRPSTEYEVYLFSLFDEDVKSIDPGNFERRWGIFTYDGQPKLPNVSLQTNGSLVAAKNVAYLPKKWCTLKSDVKDVAKIEEQLKIACAGADCTSLGNTSSCNNLDASAKASYAFNQYFQERSQTNGSCDFGGLATVTTQNPSQGNCTFFIQLDPNTKQNSPSSPSPSPSGRNNGASVYSVSLMAALPLILAQLPFLF